jgi:hypothetical protein
VLYFAYVTLLLVDEYTNKIYKYTTNNAPVKQEITDRSHAEVSVAVS